MKLVKIISISVVSVLIVGLFAGCAGDESKDQSSKTNSIPSISSTTSNTPLNGDKQFLQFSDLKAGEQIATIKIKGIDQEIKIRFFPEQAPKAVENFIGLAKKGYYNGVSFHRVIKEFMIQGGDPQGTGMGGESFFGKPFGIEINQQLHHFRGALSMARQGNPNSQGSQFFIVQANPVQEMKTEGYWSQNTQYVNSERLKIQLDSLSQESLFPQAVQTEYSKIGGTPSLDGLYSVFGQVTSGIEVVDEIAATKIDSNKKPITPFIIEKVEISAYK